MSWFYLTFVYIVLMTLSAVVNKKALNNVSTDELVFGSYVQLFTGITCLILALITGWKYEFNQNNWWQFIGMTTVYFFAVSLYFYGLKRVDLSLETIISSSGALWSLVFGIVFLGENLMLTKLTGVLLVLVSVAILFFRGKRIKIGKPELIICLSAIFYSLGAVWDKHLNQYGNPLTYIALSFGVLSAVMLLIYSKRVLTETRLIFSKNGVWKSVVLNGFFYAFSFWAIFEAYNKGGEVSRIYPITLSVSVFVSILGIWLLKERTDIVRKLLALVVMLVGVWILGW